MKLTDERRWYLRRYERGGWMRDTLGAAKWLEHRRLLIKGGLLEESDDGTLQRITDAGSAALAKAEGATP